MYQNTEELYECDNCGNVWDGDAQCLCGMEMAFDESNELLDVDNEFAFDDDMASVSSDASDMLVDFEETGHIPMETSRESIQQMLILARSQENTDEVPEWMGETRDYSTKGDFINGEYRVTAYLANCDASKTPIKEFLMTVYPMLTDEECHQLLLRLEAGMYIDDIIDGFNITRMRDYETVRVSQLHWPQWATGNVPTLELVKMRGE
jgi:hypothetical protein